MTIFKLIVNSISEIAHNFTPGVRLIFRTYRLTVTGRCQYIAFQSFNGYIHRTTVRIAGIVGHIVYHLMLTDVQIAGIQVTRHRQFGIGIVVNDRILPFDETLFSCCTTRIRANGNKKFRWIDAIVHHWWCIVDYCYGEVTFCFVLEWIDCNVREDVIA